MKILNLIDDIPHGVIKYSEEIEGSIQSSCNLAIINQETNKIKIHVFPRYENSIECDLIHETLIRLAVEHDFKITPKMHSFPGWKPNMDSKILNCVRESFYDIGIEFQEHSVFVSIVG